MWRQNYSKGGVKSGLFTTFILIAIAFGVFFNRQIIIDQINVWQFQPSSEISALAERAGIDNYGKFLYLASKPALENSEDFNNSCSSIEDTTSILGCYDNLKIYIYNVTDTKLDGVREVTAAHEMLHAAYLRMSEDEKVKLGILLEEEYKKLENDKNFSERMSFYERTEPGQRENELHSVIGTEVADISPELESHYDQYFSDRNKVVELNNKYISVFQENQDRAAELLVQYNILDKSITEKKTAYDLDYKSLESDILSFNSDVASGAISSQSQYNREKIALTSRVAALSATRSDIINDIDKQELIKNEYNLIASEIEKLNNSLDSNLAPAPSV